DANTKELVSILEEMRLNKKTIDKIVGVLKKEIGRIEQAEAPIAEHLKNGDLDGETLRKLIADAKGNRHAEARLAKRLGISRNELEAVEEACREAKRQIEQVALELA